MNKKTLKIAAIAQASLTFIFLIVSLCVDGKAETAMEALSLVFTIGTLACLLVGFLFNRIRHNHEGPTMPTEPEPTVPAEPTTPVEPAPVESAPAEPTPGLPNQ